MITYEPEPGRTISFAATEAVKLAQAKRENVVFYFNKIRLVAAPTSNPDDVAEIYLLRAELAKTRGVSPN